MSTRSRIAIRNENGSYSSIYCHFDGYPAGVGECLAKHYASRELMKRLLALGDISALKETLDKTVSYSRDRGEKYEANKAKESQTLGELKRLADNSDAEFLYVFADGKFTCIKTYGEGKLSGEDLDACHNAGILTEADDAEMRLDATRKMLVEARQLLLAHFKDRADFTATISITVDDGVVSGSCSTELNDSVENIPVFVRNTLLRLFNNKRKAEELTESLMKLTEKTFGAKIDPEAGEE